MGNTYSGINGSIATSGARSRMSASMTELAKMSEEIEKDQKKIEVKETSEKEREKQTPEQQRSHPAGQVISVVTPKEKEQIDKVVTWINDTIGTSAGRIRNLTTDLQNGVVMSIFIEKLMKPNLLCVTFNFSPKTILDEIENLSRFFSVLDSVGCKFNDFTPEGFYFSFLFVHSFFFL